MSDGVGADVMRNRLRFLVMKRRKDIQVDTIVETHQEPRSIQDLVEILVFERSTIDTHPSCS